MIPAGCNRKEHMPEKFRNGLLSFLVSPNGHADTLPAPTDFGELWVNFNKINVKKNGDTIIAIVNTFLKTEQQYDGGFEFKHDTLLLYSCKIFASKEKDSIFSTLTYKILSKGRSCNITDYRELN